MLGFLNLVVLVVAVSLAVHWVNSRVVQRNRLAAEFAQEHRVVEADTTRFIEEWRELHLATLSTELDTATQADYQSAMEARRRLDELLATTSEAEDLTELARVLEEGRFAKACVTSRMAGAQVPERRSPCFFNPMHGPSLATTQWTSREEQRVEVPVCAADAERLAQGAAPDTLQVRRGNRMVPWHRGGKAYRHYVDGYFGTYAANRAFPGFLLAPMMEGVWSASTLTPPDTGVDASGAEAAGQAHT